ncbi:MAG: ABC transporter permease [Spirochaetaceae bacterium]|nr:ABC transporter permease [Spirochaetaceae bacterium]
MSKTDTLPAQKNAEPAWDLELSSKHKLLDFNLKELIQYRDLIWLFIKRDFATQYKQTVLGPIWYIVQPLVTTVINTFIFGNLAKIGTDGVPYLLFYFAGTMLWTFFTNSLNAAAGTFSNNQAIFSKVYFPRLAVVISNLASTALKMLIQFACLIVFWIYYLIIGQKVFPSACALLFPLLVLWIGLLGGGMGMIISSLTTKYRDLNHLLGFGLNLAMYITPVVYPLSEAPEKFAWLFYLNPVSAPIELFRIWFYGAGSVPPLMTLLSLGMTFLFLFAGLILFNRNERTFVDVI